MEKKKILIVEDIHSIEIDVKNRLEEIGYHVHPIVLSSEKAMESIENEPPDIVLMDINLEGEKNGIETAQEIQQNFDIPVVFLSGETDRQLLKQASETEAYGFVAKPFQQAVLFTNIEMAFFKHDRLRKLAKENNNLKYKDLENHFYAKYIFIRSDYKLIKLDINDIIFVEAAKDYVVIHLKDRKITTHSTMKKMRQVLPEPDFIRIHRSYIIQYNKISVVKYPNLYLEHYSEAIPIGALYRSNLYDMINIV